MKAFVTTVAGLSTRFSRDLPEPALKCIYHEDRPEDTLLYRLLEMAAGYDELVVVGGYQYDALQEYVRRVLPPGIRERVRLVYNEAYDRYGSGWSLYRGLRALEQSAPEQILFAEGDLFVDRRSMERICSCGKDAVAVNHEPIRADKSVALYFSVDGRPHYVYDTAHGTLSIPEPFKSIHNSGQIWNFADTGRLFALLRELPEEEHQKTNLKLIDPYFAGTPAGEVLLVPFDTWINCNTVQDFQRINFR